MMGIQENPAVGQILTLLKPLGKGIPLQAGEIVEALVVDLFPFGGLTLKLKGGYLPARTDLVFEKNDTLSLKVMGLKGEAGEFSLQLLNNKAGAREEARPPLLSNPDRERIEELTGKIADLVLKMPIQSAEDGQQPETPAGQSSEVGRLKVLLEDLVNSLPTDIRSLPKDIRVEIQQILQASLSLKEPGLEGTNGELSRQIGLSLKDSPEVEAGLKPSFGVGLERIEDLVKKSSDLITKVLNEGAKEAQPAESNQIDRSLDVGRLRGLLENLLKALPSDMQTLPKGLRAHMLQVLQSSLKEAGQGLPERVIQLFNQLPEEMSGPNGGQDLPGKLLVSMDGVRSGQLKEALENSGVVLEARLKALVEKSPQGEPVDFPVDGKNQKDLKALLLQLKEVLQEKKEPDSPLGLFQKMLKGVETGRGGEARSYENILGKVEPLLKDVETFQLLSKITDSFYTFLPVQWAELKRGELILKRRRPSSGGPSYSCSIHLDLERVGSVSVFIFMQQRDFFVTFKVGHEGLNSLIHSHLGQLKKNFNRAGLNLKNFFFLRESDDLQEPFDRIGTEETIVSIRI